MFIFVPKAEYLQTYIHISTYEYCLLTYRDSPARIGLLISRFRIKLTLARSLFVDCALLLYFVGYVQAREIATLQA